MGFHLADDVAELAAITVGMLRVPARPKDICFDALDDGGIVFVGHDRVLGVPVVGVADHVEQREILRPAIDHPRGIEDLVTAVLGVDVGEHDQFDVGGVTVQADERIVEIGHLGIGHGESHVGVGSL